MLTKEDREEFELLCLLAEQGKLTTEDKAVFEELKQLIMEENENAQGDYDNS